MLKQQPPWRLLTIIFIIMLPITAVGYLSIIHTEEPKLMERVFGEIEEEIRKDSQPNNTGTDQTWSEGIVPEVAQVISDIKQEKSTVPKMPPEDILIQVEKIEEPSLANAMSQYITSAEENIYGIDKAYAITSVTKYDANWYYISIGISDSRKQFIHEGTFDSQPLIAHRSIEQTWEIGIYGTDTFTSLLNSLPEEYISTEAKTYIDPNLALYSEYSIKPSETVTYKFPWPSGKARVWWNRGTAPTWHGGNGSTTIALDFGSSSSTDRDIVAAAKGTITHQCIGSKTVNLVVQDASGKKLEYFHFNKDELSSRLYNAQGALEAIGKLVQQGEFLGKAQIGDFGYLNAAGQYVTDGCGIAFQTNSHLHLVFPKPSITMDNWTFTYPSLTATNDESTKNTGSSFTSSNGSTTPPPPSTTEPNVDEYGILHGERWNIMPPVDVTGDGKADLVSFDTLTGKIDVTRSYGNKFGNDPGMIEGWEVWREDPNYATESWRLLPLADATGDERADLIFYNRSTREVHVSAAFTDPADGKDKFGTIRNWNQDTEYNENTWNLLAPADVTGDGKADLIAFQKTSTQVYVTPSTGTSFGDPSGGGYTEWNSNTGYDSTNWKLLNPTDITGDEKADLIAYRANQGKIDVTPSTGTNFGGGILGFNEWRTDLNYFTPTWEIQQPADATGDEKADIIFYNNSTTEIHVVPSEGLNGPKAYKWNSNTGYDSTNWRLLVSADVDGKNGADLVAYDVRSTKVDVTRSTGNTFGIAKYGFENWNSNSGYGAVWEKLDPADVTGDGKSDIITFHMNDGRIDVSRAVGNSYSSAEVWRSTNLAYAGTNWIRLAPADINNDSKADIVFFNTATTEVHIRLSNGNSFGTAVNWNANTGLDDPTWEILDPSDMDNNGAADLVARNKLTGEIKVCYSNYITFESCQTISNTNWTSPNWAMIAPGDINGDEYIDLIAYNANSQIMELRINNQIGGFNTPISFQTLPGFGTSTRILDPADVNGDEKDDIILFNPSNTEASVLISNGNGFGITPLIDSTWNYATGYDTTNWEILEPTDSTGDGKADLITIHINPAKAIYTQIDLTRSTGSTFGPGYTDFEVWNYNTGYN